jgi:hypothetical protein
MAITDNIIYRLKPEFGDSAPHNEIGGGNILSGGTISLEDRSGGAGTDMAWQFSGADSTATGISKTITPSAAAGGYTMAVTLKVVTNPSVDFTSYIRHQNSSTTTIFWGLSQNGANQIRGRYNASSGAMTDPIGTVNNTELTYVLRVSTNSGGNEVLDIWKKTAGRVGNSPDVTGNSATLSSTFNQLLVGGQNGVVLQIKDWVIWSDEKTNAECAAAADDLRGQIDAPVGGTASGATITGTSTLLAGAATGSNAGSALGVTLTASASLIAGSATVITYGTITSDPFRNWTTGDPLENQNIENVVVIGLNRATVVSRANQTTNSQGRLVIVDSSLTAGTDYMLGTFDADGTNRGMKRYKAT